MAPQLDSVPRPFVLLVTGLSGAGKSVALKALEDSGYEAVDNLPLPLLPALVATAGDAPVAVGIDTRTRGFDPAGLVDAVSASGDTGRRYRLLFLDCAGHELVRRFSETRRRHPLALDRPAGDGIAREREILEAVRRSADAIIDTTDYSSNDLRRAIAQRFQPATQRGVTLTLMSFAYARGVPRDADLVFDMRYLANPHWVPDLRSLDGTDRRVRSWVEADPAFAAPFEAIMALLSQLLPGYARESRAYVTVAFGCTGGRHRSVATAEAAGDWLAAAGHPNVVVHRDRLHDGAAETLEDPDGTPREGNA